MAPLQSISSAPSVPIDEALSKLVDFSFKRRVPRILVVDDEESNREILAEMLHDIGYNPLTVADGRSALDEARRHIPELILTDISMPVMDGYELCRQIKSDPQLRDIPVLFISSLVESEDKIRAFEAGGDDYIPKPFHFAEVGARVDAHLRQRLLQMELKSYNEQLDMLVREKSRQLAEAHARLEMLDKTKGDFLQLISHELRTPLQGLFGAADLLFEKCPQDASTVGMIEVFQRARQRLLTLIDNALLLTSIEIEPGRFERSQVPFGGMMKLALERTACFAASRGVRLGTPPDDSVKVAGEVNLLPTAIHALLETAVKFCLPNEAVTCASRVEDGKFVLLIEAHGKNIPDELLPRFFEVLAVSKAITVSGDIGLEPSVARRIINLFGGSVSLENLTPPGIRFEVRLRSAP